MNTVVCNHCKERFPIEALDSDCLCSRCASVGRLIPWTSDGFVLCCEDCYLHDRPDHVSLVTSHPNASKVYRINVFPYEGTCHFCSKTLVEPATNGWPELFNGRGSEREYPKPDAKVVDLTPEQCRLVSKWVNSPKSKSKVKIVRRKVEHLLDIPQPLCSECGVTGYPLDDDSGLCAECYAGDSAPCMACGATRCNGECVR